MENGGVCRELGVGKWMNHHTRNFTAVTGTLDVISYSSKEQGFFNFMAAVTIAVILEPKKIKV